MDSISPDYTRWCEGLKSIGRRRLRPDEIARLRLETRAALRKIWLPVSLGLASPLVLFVALQVGGNEPKPPLHRMIPGLALFLLGLAFLPGASILLLRDRIKEWRVLRKDLKDGIVEQFTVAETVYYENIVDNFAEIPHNLEILPNSVTVFSVNGVRPERRNAVHVYETSSPPESQSLYAVPSQVAALIPPEVLQQSDVERRRLGAAELDELRRHVQESRRPNRRMLFLLAWFGLAVVSGIWHRDTFFSWLREYMMPLAVVTGATLYCIYQFVRTVLASRALEEDSRSAWVIAVHEKPPGRRRLEYLAESGALWSAEGMPVGWRLKNAKKCQPCNEPDTEHAL